LVLNNINRLWNCRFGGGKILFNTECEKLDKLHMRSKKIPYPVMNGDAGVREEYKFCKYKKEWISSCPEDCRFNPW